MPKIIVREIDKTKAGSTEYSNFAVLVPGFSSSAAPTGFDDNDVQEFYSQDTFITNVGKKPMEETVVTITPAVPAVPRAYAIRHNFGTEETPVYTKQFTAEDVVTYANTAYTGESYEPTSVATEGHLIVAETSGETTTYTKFTKVAGPQVDATYTVIDTGNEGTDYVPEVPAVTGTAHQMGNQIAYELLGMGYPVIYKLIKPAQGKTFYDVLNDPTFWEPMKDKSLYDFRYVVNGMLDYNTLANGEISKLASYNNSAEVIGGVSASTGRGDCTALCDIGEDIYNISNKTISEKIKLIKTAANGQTNADKYTAICANSVTYGGTGDTAYESNLKFPASFHYLACAVKATENYAEWYAVSGYSRGYANRTVESTLVKLGDAAVNILQPRNTTSQAPSTEDPALTHAVNIVVKQKDGYYFWGNRTAETLTTTDLVASHFLNIRQLCTTIKKQLYITCRQLAFEPNSEVLWNTFRSKIEPLLDKMKADQGIKDYRILKVADNRKALLKAKVRIIPIEAVEDFDISLYLEDDLTGADIEEG